MIAFTARTFTRTAALLLFSGAIPALTSFAAQVAPPVKPAKDGTLVYQVNARGDRVPDFSHAGYGGGGVRIPQVPARVLVQPADGDDGARIQIAIDHVSALTPDADGIRGAVQLAPGRYEIAGQLRIEASGVILRGAGSGEDGSVLVATGTDRRALISITGKNDAKASGQALLVVDDYVAVGATRLTLNDRAHLKADDLIRIERPSTKEWIEAIGMHVAPARTPFQWRAGKQNVVWERTVISISGEELTLDAPLTTALEKSLGGGIVTAITWPGRIENAGVESLRCVSAHDPANPRDEAHAWDAVHVDSVRDAWVRDVTALHFAGSAVYLDADANRVTVQDCTSLDPVSEIGGYRRHTFHTSGQQTLFLRCRAEDGRNDFTVGYLTAGPNAFVESHAERSTGFSGGIGAWSSGTLFDNVHIDGGELRLDNMESYNQGAGWAAVNSVIWEASAARFIVRTPPGANNWAVGVWGLFTGDGAWARTSEFAEPGSLYRAQLAERLGANALGALGNAGRGESAAGTPALEVVIPDLQKQLADRREAADIRAPGLVLKNGWLVAADSLLTGRQTGVTWWRGRLDPARAAEIGPSLTRFVPGRSGTGLTDDLSELTDSMIERDQVAMRHNYGLWYDRRRDDHQMNKRPDADVWAPFYEQPFLRSGQGEAWDRLSRYDLTRYNPWYFERLKTFAALGRAKGLVLINEMYFQHNILESAGHWVDSPWRPVNNINNTGFTEPPPITGDTIKMADEFYDVNHPGRRPLHRAYIRQCLEALAEQPNVIHTLSEEYTGPLHFMEFWIDVSEEWMRETGKRPLLALSATKDVQDAILADPRRAAVISVIDFKYWWRASNGAEYAPMGGENLAPRQHQRKSRTGGRADAESIASMVREYKEKFPGKAIISPLEAADGWAFAFAGGSLPKLPQGTDSRVLAAIPRLTPATASGLPEGAMVLAGEGEWMVYLPDGGAVPPSFPTGGAVLSLRRINPANGQVLENHEGTGSLSSTSPASTASPAGKAAILWWSRN